MTIAELLDILATRNPNAEVLVHATTSDGTVAVCDVRGHTSLGDEGIVLLADCSVEPPVRSSQGVPAP